MPTESHPQTQGGKSVVFVHTQKIVSDFREKMFGLVERWYAMGHGGEMVIECPNGKKICYAGIKFKGSPRSVFWGKWSEEFFETDIPAILESVANLAYEVKENIGICVVGAQELLSDVVESVYRKMQDVDSRLVGDGIRLGQRWDTSTKIHRLQEYILLVSELFQRKYSLMAEQGDESRKQNSEILHLTPSFYGIGIDLKALYRRICRLFPGKQD